jgi:hypothetical protein
MCIDMADPALSAGSAQLPMAASAGPFGLKAAYPNGVVWVGVPVSPSVPLCDRGGSYRFATIFPISSD